MSPPFPLIGVVHSRKHVVGGFDWTSNALFVRTPPCFPMTAMLQASQSILFIMIILGSSSAHALRSHAARASTVLAMKRSSAWSHTSSGKISNYTSEVYCNVQWQANSEGRPPMLYIHYIYTYISDMVYSRWYKPHTLNMWWDTHHTLCITPTLHHPSRIW